jgi:2'-hydroxyisoflavone reductase
MRILLLGGTIFVGRHLVDAARDRGHQVTILHRGVHSPHRDDLERIVADRDGDLAALRGRQWDAAIDVAAYLPRTVTTSTNVLGGAVDRYVFVSTRNVYADLKSGVNESSLLNDIDDATLSRFEALSTADAQNAPGFFDAYGGLKARCEAIVSQTFGPRALLVRPGLIVGPHDPTDRFTYWPSRVARGGEVLAPGAPDASTRFVDVRDLAAWVVSALEQAAGGVFDVIGARGWTMGSVLATCRAVAGSDATFTWVDEEFLLEKKVAPWSELPLWLPREWKAAFGVSDERACSVGLRFRPLEQTARDVLDWDRMRSSAPRQNGLPAHRELELLAAFRARHGGAIIPAENRR